MRCGIRLPDFAFTISEPALPTHARHSRRSRFYGAPWTSKSILFIGIIVVVFIVRTARRERWVRDFGYLTRPIWDKSEDTPKRLINHYQVQDAQPGELCMIHGWNPLSTSQREPARIFDCFLISVELDLLEVRMRELVDVVDYFLVLEATRSFSGSLRNDMAFQDARANGRFAFADAKIRYRLVDDFLPHPPSPFVNEARMRTHMDSLLHDNGVTPGDIVLMSDVDEIPSARTIRLLKECNGWPSPLHLNMRNYRYSFEFPLVDSGYWRPKAVRWGPDVRYNHVKASEDMLADAGWHCSWCFRYVEDIQFKMTGYSHNDRVKNAQQLEPARITRHTCDGSDIFDMLPEAYTFHDLYVQSGKATKATSFINIPNWVVRNAAHYRFLLPGGCARETRSKI